MRCIDISGMKFGRWTVIGKSSERMAKHVLWSCKCDCGTVRNVPSQRLRNGGSQSCGCLISETTTKRLTTHGATAGGVATREFSIWTAMKSRCYNPKHNRYHRYGGRGVKVCDRWVHSFENFLDDMGECPSGLSIERKNNDLDYCKENCKWATATEQARNRSTCRPIEFNGRTMLISDWAAEMGVNRALLTKRFNRGWSIADTLTTPNLYQKAA